MDVNGVGSERVDVEPYERHTVEYLADMYATITALEKLERAHNRDWVAGEAYGASLEKLLDRFRTVEAQLRATHQSRYVDVESFMESYDMTTSCAAALSRLRATKAATQEKPEAPGVNPQEVLEAAQYFITAMDALRLRQTAADQLHPVIADLVATVRRVAPGFEHLPRLEGWLARLDTMAASEQLDDAAARDMQFDLDRGYQAFHHFLGQK